MVKSKALAKARALAKAKAEKEAIEKITEATLAGIQAGEDASKRLHDDAKVQTEEKTTIAIEKLKTKFDNTKRQVMAIVQNFGKIHSDLQELKQEYIQEQQNGGINNNLVQLGETGSMMMDGFLNDPKVLDLKAQLSQKNEEI